MKNQITQLVVLFFMAVNVSAQSSAGAATKSISAAGTFFKTPITDARWNNANGKSFTKAQYANYSGETEIRLNTEWEVDANIKLAITLVKGELDVEMVNSKGEKVYSRKFQESENLNFDAHLEAGETYLIRFIGRGAKGSYYCHWTEKTNQPNITI
ncbi:MAG: hypothetical protein ITG00_04565 [Flavobacterium sp.]|nr:hypothetical protein [Flavobacterium sp.]